MSRRVILNADDYGYDPGVSRGIAKAMREGLVSSTTMMVNTPHASEAAHQTAGLSIGLHLNLARWSSLARPRFIFVEADAGRLEEAFVIDEVEAQLDALERLIGRPATHLDVHKHLHRHATILSAVATVCGRRGVPVRSIGAEMRQALLARNVKTNDVFLGDAGAEPFWTLETFEQVVGSLPSEGVIELMCHPGFAPTAVSSGYSAQREVELATFLSPRARAFAERVGVTFVPWR